MVTHGWRTWCSDPGDLENKKENVREVLQEDRDTESSELTIWWSWRSGRGWFDRWSSAGSDWGSTQRNTLKRKEKNPGCEPKMSSKIRQFMSDLKQRSFFTDNNYLMCYFNNNFLFIWTFLRTPTLSFTKKSFFKFRENQHNVKILTWTFFHLKCITTLFLRFHFSSQLLRVIWEKISELWDTEEIKKNHS